jgi:hypothetical protein
MFSLSSGIQTATNQGILDGFGSLGCFYQVKILIEANIRSYQDLDSQVLYNYMKLEELRILRHNHFFVA